MKRKTKQKTNDIHRRPSHITMGSVVKNTES